MYWGEWSDCASVGLGFIHLEYGSISNSRTGANFKNSGVLGGRN